MDEDQIEKYRHDLEYVRKAARQTEIDFSRFGYEISIDSELTGNWQICCMQLEEAIRLICKENSRKLEAILYHIDVPEHKVHPLKACSDPEHTAHVIFQRELIKAILKRIYSPGTD